MATKTETAKTTKKPTEKAAAKAPAKATAKSASKASDRMRVIVRGYDSALVDDACGRIVRLVVGTGSTVRGPVPLPTKKEIVTILRAVHKYKDSREQFERRIHKRLIDIYSPSQKTIETLTRLDLPAGVDFEVKLNA